MYKGFLTAHKKGGQIVFKPSGIYAFKALQEIKAILKISSIASPQFFSHPKINVISFIPETFKKSFRFNIRDVIDSFNNPDIGAKTLEEYINSSPISYVFSYYNLGVACSLTLANYLKKEQRRQQVANTPFSTQVVSTDLPLYERCSTGTNLMCIQDFKPVGTEDAIFIKGRRYMVVDTGDEIDKVVISTNSIKDGATVNLAGTGARYEWTAFESSMEEWFDDSAASAIPEKNIFELYPERISAARAKLKSFDLALFDHVKEDAIAHSLKRSSLDCKLMRMGKSSTAIATAEITGSQKIAVITTKNIRIFWVKEFKRLGIKDYVIVNKLADLEKPGRYYILTLPWIRSMTDKEKKPRKDKKSYLTNTLNSCPHCKEPLGRFADKKDEEGNISREWSLHRGYICNNIKCTPVSDDKKKKGAAWHRKTPAVGKPGSYMDPILAQHANCDLSLIKGRQCPTCKAVDSVWKPPMARRFEKHFSMVIGDEIHNAKSISTLNAAGLYRLRARRKMGLTGTPMSNSVMDIYWPCHWLFRPNTNTFPYAHTKGYKDFENDFCQHIYLEKPTGEIDEQGNEIFKNVRKRIPFLSDPVKFWKFIEGKIVRRTYSDALYQQSLINAGLHLPTTSIHKVVCPMHPDQANLMLSALQNFKKEYSEIVQAAESNNHEVNESLVIAKMSTLQTIATSPERLNDRYNTILYSGPDGGGKTANIAALVKQKIALGEKVVILSNSIYMQKAVEKELIEYNPIRFDVDWDEEEREESFQKFADEDKYKIFIAGTKAIREGVDLSTASTVVCCDLLWSPAFQAQAWSRTMAPTKFARNCEVYLFLSEKSLDEHMFNVFYSKMTAAEQAFDKKVVARRAQHVDIRAFVDKVLDDEAALSLVVRDYDDGIFYNPMMNVSEFGERF